MFWISFVISLAVVWLLDRIGNVKRMKTPGGKIPNTGGVAILGAIMLPLLLTSHCGTMIFWSIFMAFSLGFLDDLFNYGPWSKLIVELAIALTLVQAGYRLGWFPLELDMIASVVWVMGMMNAINLVDNMDGLAAGLVIIAGAFFYVITKDPLALILCGALAGFLLFNYQPASIYMGDCGSLMIGLVLALLPMIHRGRVDPYCTVLILYVPLCDMVRLCFRRPLREKKPPWKGGRDHISHILAKRLGERRAVIALYGVAASFGFVGVYG